MYEAKKTLCALGLSYEKINACPNDCILYRKEYEDSTNCPTCGISRGKETKDGFLKEGVAAKVLWYFPPIPRLKRLFQSHETAKNLTWHAARKSIDDVYLEPLIDDLKSLWDGIRGVYDAHIGEYFTLRVALLWTINDFPTYGNLSGCVVKGYKACPICGDDTPSHSAAFNGKPEYGTPLEPLTGEEVLHMVEGPWNLSRAEKRAVCNSFYGMKVPEGYSSNIKNLVSLQDSRLLGLKSHDCHTLMQQLLPVEIRSVLEKPARWMYPFERYMKVLKGYVQNRTHPEGCIAERYIAEEAVEFCTEHLSDISTIGVPSSQKIGVSKPLSGCTVSLVDRDLLNQAHLYVLENTEEVLPYIEWLVAGPNMAVPLYRSYLIKGVKFNIKAQDDVRTVQNSGVYLLAHTMQVASAKDKNPIISNMGFYGVIQEIWDLDYQKFTIPVFRCDWIDSTSGLVVDELGFTLVDLSKIGHRNDQFVLASQVKQVFFVDDPMHHGWSVVLSTPNREYNDDVIGDDVLGDVRIECEPFTRGMPNVDTFDELVGEFGSQNIRNGCEDIWIE
ncbi:hypothetical protein ACE6H2_010803 [Prunus campanulata]